MSETATHYDPFEESLWGEYARILLVGTTAVSAAVWTLRLADDPVASVMIIANILVMGVAVGSRFAGLRRLTVLAVLVAGIVAALAIRQDPTIWWSPLVMCSPMITVAALLVLVFRDGLIAIKTRTSAVSLGNMFLVAAVIVAGIYMIVVPSIDGLLSVAREQPASFKVEESTPAEILRIRSAKLVVFSIFAYTGACVGSFLNVVAASAPRGESIALRSSACPKCGTPIRRIDNLPIISYIRLGGRCRDCGVVIPVRYFTVELVGLVIFGSLFLYELVTGAANVPGFRHYTYTGILWIILYAKWPVIGIYVFHCVLFSALLMLALMEQDHLRAPRWIRIGLPVVFTGIVVAFPTMLTVSVADQTPLQFPAAFPDWVDRAANCLVGGLLGWGLGHLGNSTRLRRRQASSSLTLCFALLGISLGWQAVFTIAFIWVITIMTLKRVGGRFARRQWLTVSTWLFVIAMLHHPLWKWLAGQLSF